MSTTIAPQYKPETEINQAAYQAALTKVLEIEAAHEIIREAFEEIPEPYNVEFFTVLNALQVGRQRHHSFISPHFATVEQARDFKADALESYPDCYVQGGTAYYRSEDDGNRLELLAGIIPAQNQQA